ncbi:ABC transporter ATP-binding protein [Hondaea fermentalgiana]|uniref:ABC transporter ATP-binding protein n=1 Tax=Hondaea fermentalgiana TaxID=2315210 RepID=A0A2R5GG52_9STRA|nr:ABC transporter ATP-binding protein [Hondaea fermentalgiana]|eukprot:GBG28748.1 ABC transporter ATP-binding protein [Hondaea fermentalgiana]
MLGDGGPNPNSEPQQTSNGLAAAAAPPPTRTTAAAGTEEAPAAAAKANRKPASASAASRGGRRRGGKMTSALLVLLQKNWKLKRKAPRSLFLEFALPLLFVALFAAIKRITDVARVSAGWTREGVSSCSFDVPEDAYNLTCTSPYSRFISDTTSFDLLANNFRGRWAGHETARIFIATSTGAAREIEALNQFISWVAEVGTAEGTQSDFADLVFTLGNGTVQEINNYVRSAEYGNPAFSEEAPECAVALVFDLMDFENAQFEYTLRLNSTSGAPLFEAPRTTLGPTYNTEQSLRWVSSSENPEYVTSGFVSFQRLIDSWLISTVGGVSSYDDIWQPFTAKFIPFPVYEHIYDEFFSYTADIFPLVFSLVYLYPVSLILEGLVRERETRVDEMLKIMGVTETLIITSWYITYVVIFLLLSIIITGLCSIMLPVSASSQGGSFILFLLFFFYGIAIISLCFTMSTFFTRARTASYVGVVLYFMGFFLFYLVTDEELDPKPLPILFIPQVAFSLSLQSIASLEASTVGISATTLGETAAGFTVGQGLGMIIFDVFLWTLIGSYFSIVSPYREFGHRRKGYFCLTPKYWISTARWAISILSCGRLGVSRPDESMSLAPLVFSPDVAENIETRASSAEMRRPRVQVRDLRKVFSTPSGPKTAVDGLSLDMYEGEILALLGHNGAGKTTTLQILSGMLPSSGGQALIGGASIDTDMTQIRRSLGFCPQHDVLYPTLTVQEHLWFYGSIKGLSGTALKEAIKASVDHVGLTEKVHTRTKALSGGMKRKLSVAIALLGDSKVVFVDEPTSGVDPWSRRFIWQLLQDAREGRVIVLTTHFMDEADVLGDQIAIMAEGKLKCLGSSLFLKRRFGAGYVLTMVKKPEADPTQDAANVKQIRMIVTKYVPQAVLSSNVGTEVTFQLPTASAGKFPALFQEIDSSSLPIEQYGVSVTTLEEVFLQVARADDQKRQVGRAAALSADPEEIDATFEKDGSGTKHTSVDMTRATVSIVPADGTRVLDDAPMPSSIEHFKALFVKRMRYARRDKGSFGCSIILPVILFAVGLIALRLAPIGDDDPLYTLSTDDYNPNIASSEAALPVMEFDTSGASAARVAQAANFPSWELEPRTLEPYPDDEVVTIFERDYVNGLPTSEIVCRASAEDYCITDELTAYKVDPETFDLYLASGSEVVYCDETRAGGTGADPGDGTSASSAPTTAPTLSSLPATGYCYVSTIDEVITEALVSLIQNSSLTLNLTEIFTISDNLGEVVNITGNLTEVLIVANNLTDGLGGSVDFDTASLVNASDPQNVTCNDELFTCSFVALEPADAAAAQVCVFDSCVSDPAAYTAAVESLLPGFNESLANGTRYDCEETAAICDVTVDLVQLEGLSTVELNGEQVLLLSDLVNISINPDAVNLTAIIEDNPGVVGELLAALSDPGNSNLTEVLSEVLPDGVSLSEDFNLTEILEDPEVAAALTEVVQDIFNAENELVECTDPNDTCLLSQISFVIGTLCAPVGCRSDFTQGQYAYVPLLGNVTSFEDVALFECNGTACNDGCRSGGNCEAEDLDPLQYNATDDSFSNGTMQWCPPAPWRYGYTALVNSTARHGAPIVANAIHSALLRQKVKELNVSASNPFIRTNTQPLPITSSLQTVIAGYLAFTAAIFALIAFAFVPASVASYIVQEREETANVKLSQLLSGAGIIPYWLSLYAFDLLNFLFPLVGSVALIFIFDIRTYIDNGVIVAVVFLLLGYGMAVIPFAYLTSNLFKTHTTALIMTLFINLITGLILMIASFVMESIDNDAVNEANVSLKWVYRIFPGFCLGDALMQLSIIYVLSAFVGPSYVLPSPYDMDIAGASLAYLYVEAAVFLGAVLLIEYLRAYPSVRESLDFSSRAPKLLKRLRRFRNPADVSTDAGLYDPIDEDVAAETERVHSGGAEGDAVVIKDIAKVYGTGKVAVRGLTLGIKAGETFGLLGVNGAGKTTTLKMLTGELPVSSGSASIGGFSIASSPRDVHRLIGYCPQFDALLDLLTVREHLELFGRIKGLSGARLKANINRLLHTLTLEPFEHKLTRGLSGGTKRKLSLAIALIGAPRVIFLDEPTTGVDAVSKRFIWDVLDDVRDGLLGHKTTLVLTSHSMEEVEALSTRLGIMVGGRFRCIGSAQHLKNRFGDGLLLEATLEPPARADCQKLLVDSDLPDRVTWDDIEAGALDVLGQPARADLILGRDDAAWALCHQLDESHSVSCEALVEWWLIEDAKSSAFDAITKAFPGAMIVERHDLSLRFSLPDIGIASVFAFVEKNKADLHIQDYAVSQVSLESIFNLFASQQEEESGVARGVKVEVEAEK